MAPEIVEAKVAYDGTKTDMFSAGVVLFTLVNAVMPFKSAQISDKNYRVLLRGNKDRFFTEFEKMTGRKLSADF